MKNKKSKKCITLTVISLLLILLTGCSFGLVDTHDTEIPDNVISTVAEASETPEASIITEVPETVPKDASAAQPHGETETFTYINLIIEMTNVVGTEIIAGIQDDGDRYEYPCYVLSTGAQLSAVNADMTDGSFTENGKPRPNWYIYLHSGERIPITDDMEAIEITNDMAGIISGEASIFILTFEFRDNTQIKGFT